MNDYLIVIIAAIFASVFLSVLVQWRFGNGLMSKLFRVVMLSIAVIGNIGFLLGKQGITGLTFSVTVGVAVALVLMMVVVIQKTIIIRVQTQADAASGVITDLLATSAESAASSEQQVSAVAQVNSALSEIHQMSQSTADTSQDVVKVAEQAVEKGRQGLDLAREALRIMELFSGATDFVDVVNQVAERSNLLALNASIEAAKAEKYGRGFAVVAEEVRNLAERSREAAQQIRKTIHHSENGRKAVQSTNTVIESLASVLSDSSEKSRKISGASVQQSAGISQIAEAMNSMVQSGEHTANTSKQIKKAAEQLKQINRELSLLLYGNQTSLMKGLGSAAV
jgi:methyl-accepting chemotaxis protein